MRHTVALLPLLLLILSVVLLPSATAKGKSIKCSKYKDILEDKDKCTAFVKGQTPEGIKKKKTKLVKCMCAKPCVKEAVKDLPEGDLKKAWAEVCAKPKIGWTTWLVIGISAATILVAIVAVIYWYRSSKK